MSTTRALGRSTGAVLSIALLVGCAPSRAGGAGGAPGSGGGTASGGVSGSGNATTTSTTGVGGVGSGAGAGGAGQGGCSTAQDCPGTDTGCVVRSCVGGLCGTTYAPAVTPCNEGGGTVCNGTGSCVECMLDAECA